MTDKIRDCGTQSRRRNAYIRYTVTEKLGYVEKYGIKVPMQFKNKNKNRKYHERIKRAAFVKRYSERRQRRKIQEAYELWKMLQETLEDWRSRWGMIGVTL